MDSNPNDLLDDRNLPRVVLFLCICAKVLCGGNPGVWKDGKSHEYKNLTDLELTDEERRLASEELKGSTFE